MQFVSDDAIYYQEDNIETSTISLPTPPTKNGYEFLGWYTQADGHGNKFDDTTTIISNMVVYAYWINSQKIFRNGVVKNPTAPTKDGYTFAGWYTDKDLTVEYDFTSKVTKSFTLYAKWNDVKSDDGTEATPAPTGEPTTEPQPTAKPDDTAKSMPFTDVNAGDWFYNNVQYVYENGLMNGVSETEFAPNENVTRGMFVTILYRMGGEPNTGASTFTDVPSGRLKV